MRFSIVFLCSGQGSQYFNMTYQLYEENVNYRNYLDELDEYCYEITGYSVLTYLFDKSKKLSVSCDDLQLSSLALMICQYSLGKLLIDQGIYPDYIVGSSMGEFVAVALSHNNNLKDVIKVLFEIVRKVAEKCQKGGMVSILDNSNMYFDKREIFGDCEIAGINYDNNFVVSGSNKSLGNVIDYLKQNRIIFQRLPVKYAFHSKMIEEIRNEAKNKLNPWQLKVPIGSCAYGRIIKEIPHSYIWDVLRKPMLFQQMIKSIEKNMNPVYIDLGPNGTLSNFVKRGEGSKHKSYSIINMYNTENENLKRLMDDLNSTSKVRQKTFNLRR